MMLEGGGEIEQWGECIPKGTGEEKCTERGKKRNRHGEDTRERIISRHYTEGENKGEKTQAVFFLCCQQGIEIWERRKLWTG